GDALGVRLAWAPVRGGRRDRAVADRGPVVGRRTRPRVLAGGGARRRGLGPVPPPPPRPLAHGAVVGLNRARDRRPRRPVPGLRGAPAARRAGAAPQGMGGLLPPLGCSSTWAL